MKRDKKVTVRMSDEEHEELKARSVKLGIPMATLLRGGVLPETLPKAKPPPEAEASPPEDPPARKRRSWGGEVIAGGNAEKVKRQPWPKDEMERPPQRREPKTFAIHRWMLVCPECGAEDEPSGVYRPVVLRGCGKWKAGEHTVTDVHPEDRRAMCGCGSRMDLTLVRTY